MHSQLKRRLVIGATTLAAAAFAGGAYAASQDSATNTRQAFLNDVASRLHVSPQQLTSALKEKGWQVRRVKEDGGCYEVYALNEKGERVEAYFHPRTLAPVPHGAKNHKG